MRLANLTWPKAQEYFEKNDMVLISIGSIECHGRHMPLGTDTLIPDFLLEKIEQKSDVLIAPTIPLRRLPESGPVPPERLTLTTRFSISSAVRFS